MAQIPPQTPGPAPRFWDTLPQIVGKLRNEFLLVTLGILIIVVAIGVFAPGVIDSLKPAFFYLIVVLAWLAYIVGRVLDMWGKERPALEPPSQRPPAGPGGPVQPPAETPSPTPAPVGQSELDQIHQVLATRFNREELRTLCFTLGVPYENLGGEGHSARARELVLFMERQNWLDQLRAAIRAERPGAL